MQQAQLWRFAITWLEGNVPDGVTSSDLHSYFSPVPEQRPNTMEGLFRATLKSLTQAGMRKRVILETMPQGIDSLAKVTSKFSPERTIKKYGVDSQALFRDIQTKVRPKGKLREEGLWPKYCQTILSVASLLSRFEDAKSFYAWLNKADKDPLFRNALPMILSEELYGAGFALACNLLIDLGYENFAKPDRHVKRILRGCSLLPADATDYQALRVLTDTAALCRVTPYALDKALYLIGSGEFYKHKKKAPRPRERTTQFVHFVGAA